MSATIDPHQFLAPGPLNDTIADRSSVGERRRERCAAGDRRVRTVTVMQTPFEILARSKYVLLTTFRRDGTPVPTPVWIVGIGDELVVWTSPTAGKVKRIRRDPNIEIGPCSQRGKLLGHPIAGRARILDPAELGQVMQALAGKYGLPARLTALPGKVAAALGRVPRPVGGLAITLGDRLGEPAQPQTAPVGRGVE